MIVGGLQKHSFIDYPGRISCVLFLAGCNFDCPYCHNPQLAGRPEARPETIAAEEVFAFLGQRRGWLEGVVISGGEPTLHPDLPDLCRRIKALGYPVKLETNGSRPQLLLTLLREGLVDYFAMDIKTEPERYSEGIARQCDGATLLASLRILMDSGVPYEFRTQGFLRGCGGIKIHELDIVGCLSCEYRKIFANTLNINGHGAFGLVIRESTFRFFCGSRLLCASRRADMFGCQ